MGDGDGEHRDSRLSTRTSNRDRRADAGDGGFGMSQDSRQVTEAQRTLDRADADFRRLQELQTTRTAAWHQASGALAACEDWLRFGKPGNVVLEEVATEPPKLLKGETTMPSSGCAGVVASCAPTSIASRPRRSRVPTPSGARESRSRHWRCKVRQW